MSGRLTLLLSSPRIAPGLLSRSAWLALGEADAVLGYADQPQLDAVRESGIAVTEIDAAAGDLGPDTQPRSGMPLGRRLVDLASGGTIGEPHLGGGSSVVWVGSSDGDPGLTDVVAAEVTRRDDPPEVEVLLGSHDVPGARLLDLVAVMDRLRSPGGCPWDAEQTHTSLVKYLIEEAHEAAEALESGDRTHMVEELGDVLLQVVFHARVGEEDAQQPFDIDDIAAAIVAKLVRRHPHVFSDGTADSASAVEATWEAIKATERATKTTAAGGDTNAAGAETDVLHGIPVAMPSLARATKVVSRMRRAGLADLVGDESSSQAVEAGAEWAAGVRLLALVAELESSGVDPDAALRSALRDLQARLGERVGPPRGGG